MGDTENALPPSKKRAAGREISRDNPGLDDEEDTSEQETGTFKRASDQVLATRRIVKVRRHPTSAPSSNPFAGIRLVPPTEAAANKTEVKIEAQVGLGAQVGEKAILDDVDGKTESNNENEKGKEAESKQSEVKNSEAEVDAGEAEAKAELKAEGETESKVEAESKGEGDTETKSVAESKSEAESAATEQNSAEEKSNAAADDVKPASDNEPAAEEDETENANKKDEKTENVDPSVESTPLSSFQQLSSSQNAFTNLSGTGFSSSSFSFGSIAKEGSAFSTNTGSLFGFKTERPSFGLGLSNNGNSSLFGTSSTSVVSKNEGSSFPSLQEVEVETGEENEEVVFNADSVLYEYIDRGWKERGKGEIKVNVSKPTKDKARLLMRARGNYRLILNASLFPDMKLTSMDKKGLTFTCMNSTGEVTSGFSTFALKFKDASIVEEFRTAVNAHKGRTSPEVLKTPENSPKASDE